MLRKKILMVDDAATILMFSRRVSHGGQPSLLAVVRDLTQRKKTDEARKRSEARYASILDISPDAIVSVDDDQELVCHQTCVGSVFSGGARCGRSSL